MHEFHQQVLKTAGMREILQRDATVGVRTISPTSLKAVYPGLTPRSRRVADGLIRGDTIYEIAHQIHMKPHVVDEHVSTIRKKIREAGLQTEDPGSDDADLHGFFSLKQRMLEGLSPRQKEVMETALHGLSKREIMERLGISVKTVDTHLGSIYENAGAMIAKKIGLNPNEVDKPRMTAPEYLHLHAFLCGEHHYLRRVFDRAGLYPAETAIIALKAVGLSNKQIAIMRRCHPGTVNRTVQNALRKIEKAAGFESIESIPTAELISRIVHMLPPAQPSDPN